ncbi:transporter substrate-binding domain-containing protein [Microbacterium sp. NPDC089987]|uniref:transporter substrate-binding domain-containing protein n=1 Tax=Microbacterium sp. NPDC089987 TaxID=3364202 RepID=UPI00381D7157
MRRRRMAGAGALLLLVALTGCGIQMPADPHGSIDRIEGGTLRAGATEQPPWVDVHDAGEPTGSEPELIEEFAAQMDARVEWTTGSEADLLAALERGELDLVVGGFLDDTPWTDRGAVTRPYTERSTKHGTQKHVMIVRMGENALLTELETFLHEEAGS